jgi:hypothetical protein
VKGTFKLRVPRKKSATFPYFRFRSPVFKVRGRTFLGLGQDQTTAVFCIGDSKPIVRQRPILKPWGREMGHEVLGLYTETKTVCLQVDDAEAPAG